MHDALCTRRRVINGSTAERAAARDVCVVFAQSITKRRKAVVGGNLHPRLIQMVYFFFFQAEDGIRDLTVTGVQTCALPISARLWAPSRLRPFSLSEEQPRAVRVPDPAIRESAAGVGYNLHQCADEGGWRARHRRGCAARLASVGCGERVGLVLLAPPPGLRSGARRHARAIRSRQLECAP